MCIGQKFCIKLSPNNCIAAYISRSGMHQILRRIKTFQIIIRKAMHMSCIIMASVLCHGINLFFTCVAMFLSSCKWKR